MQCVFFIGQHFDNENVQTSNVYVKNMVCIEQTIEYKHLEYVIISDDYEIDSRPIRNSFKDHIQEYYRQITSAL